LKGKNLGAVGELVFDEQLDIFYEQVARILPHSEFKTGAIDFMKTHYYRGRSFSDAFASFLSSWFRDDGLVFLSPSDPRTKIFLSPIFITELTDYPKVSQLIIGRSAELEDRYHAQIKTKALNLFYFHKGGRYILEPREHDFSLKGTRHFILKEEMLRIAHEQPELLSPNVALRPICQDTLLPTIAYVAGPSEIAYFAQLKKVYQYFGLTMPVVYPRASVTLIEDKVDRLLEKYQLELPEFFSSIDKVHAKVIDQVSEVNIDEMFKEADQRINDLIKEMHFGVNYIDPTLLGALENVSEKFQQQLDVLRVKIVEAQQRKHEVALRQIAKITHTTLPNKNFQERELNILHFLNKHGLDFPKMLFQEIPIDQFKHQIIRM
jgi:bacillithiol biosynthesis cysteine-adding enzyme BshC